MSEESDVVSVNHENLDDFNSKKLGLPTAEEHAAAEEAEVIDQQLNEESSDEANPKHQESGEEDSEDKSKLEKSKKKSTPIKERLSEITAEKNQAKEEAARERAERERLQKELDALKNQPKPVEESPEPTRDKFQSEEEYIEAKAEWKSEKKLQEKEARNIWQKRVEEAKAEFPDYDEVMSKNGDMILSNAVLSAIQESEIGPKIARHLAANPDLATTLKSMSLTAQVKEIGKIEASLTKPKEVISEKKEVQVSKAPAPVSPIKGTTTFENKLDSNGVFHGSPEEWAALRKAGKIK